MITLLLIYILSIISLWIELYFIAKKESDYEIRTIGNLIDYVDGLWPITFLPFINTAISFSLIFINLIFVFCKLLKLDKLWNKIRNIKIF